MLLKTRDWFHLYSSVFFILRLINGQVQNFHSSILSNFHPSAAAISQAMEFGLIDGILETEY